MLSLNRSRYDTFQLIEKLIFNCRLLMKRCLTIVIISLLAFATSASAQKVAVKTNALYWVSTTPNLGLELALGERWTFEVEGGYNPWTLNKDTNMKMKHWLVSPEFRYWFCNSFQGHFIGINGNYTQFNIGSVPFPIQKAFINVCPKDAPEPALDKSRLEGWAVGAGLTYGYAFPIARRWNMELSAGLGWWYTVYDQFESRTCGLFQQTVQKHALGPTSLGLSFIYMIK